MANAVTAIAAAPSMEAAAHFAAGCGFETDCCDVHEALAAGDPGFVLLDVRGPAFYPACHIAGAVHCPHGKITDLRMRRWPDDTLFVAYCAGPHCNGAAHAALRLAQLGRPVTITPGGMTGWLDEGFPLEQGGP